MKSINSVLFVLHQIKTLFIDINLISQSIATSIFFFNRKQAFEAALLARTWAVKYEDIKWPKNKGKLGSRKSMVWQSFFPQIYRLCEFTGCNLAFRGTELNHLQKKGMINASRLVVTSYLPLPSLQFYAVVIDR